MARKQTEKLNPIKNRQLSIVILALKLIIFIGRLILLPFLIVKSIFNFLSYVFRTIIIYHLLLITFKKRPGRPRTTPFLIFYRKKVSRRLNRVIPKPARVTAAILMIAALIFGYSLNLLTLAKALPSPAQLSPLNQPLTTEILDRQGRLLYRIYDGQNRQLIKLPQVPKTVVNATVAAEDKNFYSHHGVDFFGMLRALKNDLSIPKNSLQGGSTITQQLIKNTLLSSDKTIQRKIKEVLLAFWAERLFDKPTILEMYLNQVAYGGPAWGISAAAKMYFGTEVADLDLAQAAYLAGLPAAPTSYSPYGTHPEKGIRRQREVLLRMVADKYISQQEAEEAMAKQLIFKPPVQDIKAPHFVMFVKSILANSYTEKTVSQGGLKVVTSLDLDIQEMVERVVNHNVGRLTELLVSQGAAMVTDAKTGQILAMVGSKDYWDQKEGNFNATLALRQPGSAVKPITYATAFKQGFSPGTILLDVPTTFPDRNGRGYSPVNYDGKFHGAVTVRTALASSYNLPAVKILATVGIDPVVETARDLGISTWDDPQSYGLSLTLGGAAVKMVDMMSVYGTLSQLGVKHQITPILSVTDASGRTLEDHKSDPGKRVLTPEVAYLITNILADNQARVPAFGEKSLLEISGHSVPVKTGTSDSKIDNWAFGYTPQFVVGSWVGNFNNSPMHPSLTSGITGATPIWHDVMLALLEGQRNLSFEKPAGVVEAVINGQKDLAISGTIPKTVTALRREVKKEVITYTDSFNRFTLRKSQ